MLGRTAGSGGQSVTNFECMRTIYRRKKRVNRWFSIQPSSPQEFNKARVRTKWIYCWIHFEKSDVVGTLLVRFLKPCKRLVLIT